MLPVEFRNVDLTERGLGTSGTGTFLYMGTKEQAGGLTGVIYYCESEPESGIIGYSDDTNYIGQ